MPRHDGRPTRRRVLTGGIAAGAVAGVGALAWPEPDRGGGHDAYFTGLSAALTLAGVAQPVMVVDTGRLSANIKAVGDTLGKAGDRAKALRIVVKSLPSHELMHRAATGLKTNRFMVFNQAMLVEMGTRVPDADFLMGKPLPVAAAAAYYDRLGAQAPGPQWLIDTPERLGQYTAMAKARGVALKVNFEIDVGLHRGGLTDPAALAAMLAGLDPAVTACGLMGYDPHVAKMPGVFDMRGKALARAKDIYARMAGVLKEKAPLKDGQSPYTFNTAGSPTYALHTDDPVATEVAVGSAFVKPTDFDIDTLAHHQPACFIATPVLKVAEPGLIPGLESLAGIAAFFDPNTARAFFVQGGHWLANPVSPPGLQLSGLYGRSSNQERWSGSRRVPLRPDDWVFLRPTQSEAVLLQFGPLLAYDGGAITGTWPVFEMSA
ncbi:alanine racemase [Nitrospirillum iridis]|uniref:D-serine deaminase-like pyridoxal phosphate-dependent protein n=1 Tax=Nitrospirillum iridis TaxID=765888 RepID=A0A7X0B2C1_9PROT|nr:alanine racemase [Nitrospirillum iridis]MBB6254448.1 D-serine deaminase-like pyridoxal phosphate-dependent protein [Nitrospirillum iridis]